MSFLFLSNINIKFAKLEKLIWKSYTTVKTLLITNQVELTDIKKFAKTVLDKNFKTFVLYITALKATKTVNIAIYLSQAAQIKALHEIKTPLKLQPNILTM